MAAPDDAIERPSGTKAGRATNRMRAAVFLLLGGLLGLILVALVVFTKEDAGQPRPVPLQNVQVGEETEEAIVRSASTPVVAVNPVNANNLVMGYRVERPSFSCGLATSYDAGRSWDPSGLTLPPGTERCYTTSPGFAKDGVLHLAFVTLAGTNNVPSAAWLTRSLDGGRTFEPAKKVLEQEKFMVRLAVDNSTAPARLLLTWVEPASIGLFQMAPPSSVMSIVSTDGGATFGQRVRVSDAKRERVGAPVPLVGSGGALHVLYQDYGKNVFDFQNIEGRYEGTFENVIATSSNGGGTFTETVVDAKVRPPEPFLVFTPPFPAMAADREKNKLYVAWSDARGVKAAVLLTVSSDGGKTWGPPKRVDDARGEALLPQLAVAPNGRLDVAYVSVGEGAGRPTEVNLTSSSDQGKTFGPSQAMNRPFFRELFPISPRREAGRDMGSGLALASKDSEAYLGWPDTRRGGSDTLRVDIVGAPASILAKGPARRPQPVPVASQ
ncbi:MAG TPA: sialidase family protein [Acidimicrobiales bacterium]|nr:sialidase family protein [Acidimicrobiales bacterium]